MKEYHLYHFDFDEWSALARTDTEAFDRKRQDTLQRVIENCGDNRRLRGLQCRIDLERMRAHTPLKACLRLSGMMWDSFYELSDSFNQPGMGGTVPERKAAARVLPFNRKSSA